jgi:hypothetical protein
MTGSILRAVVCGVIAGALAFFMPHLLLGIFIFVLVVRLFHCCGRGQYYGHYNHHERLFYMADRIRKMSEEEYAEFKIKMGGGCCNSGYHSHGHCCCGSDCDCKSDSKCDNESKKEETTK